MRSWQVFFFSLELHYCLAYGPQLNILFADLLMSLGAILDVKWANERHTYCGSYCNVQGAIQILGETSVALFTLAITIYTFVSVVRGRVIKYRPLMWGGVTAAIWLFVLLWAVLGYATHPKSGNDSFYTPTPYCESKCSPLLH
jgi:hypothetical protein